jgi:hypothetical protein
MHTMGEPVSSAISLEQNVPCENCGYNLRGLTVPGRCPECGTDLEPSIRAHQAHAHELLPPDPAWAAKIRAGVCLALVALALMVLPFFLPSGWFRMPFRNAPLSRTPGRIVLLSIECVAWTLAWAAAWRLASREPVPNEPARRGAIAVSLRWLSTAYMLVPFCWAWPTWDTQYPRGARLIPFLALLIAGLLSAFALLWRVGQILRRREAWLLALLARLLAVAVTLGSFLLLTPGYQFGRDDPSSLGLMLSLPSYPFGSPELLFDIISELARGRFANYWLWVFLAPLMLTIMLFARIWFAYRPSVISTGD